MNPAESIADVLETMAERVALLKSQLRMVEEENIQHRKDNGRLVELVDALILAAEELRKTSATTDKRNDKLEEQISYRDALIGTLTESKTRRGQILLELVDIVDFDDCQNLECRLCRIAEEAKNELEGK